MVYFERASKGEQSLETECRAPLVLRPQGPFSAGQTLFCGQCFRWRRQDGGFAGVAHGRRLFLREAAPGQGPVPGQAASPGVELWLYGAGEADRALFTHYFACDEDYAALQRRLSRSPKLARCIACAPGIRVLHQDYFEMLMTFLISQNNNIPRITAIVERLCAQLGGELGGGEHAFPAPEVIAAQGEAGLSFLRAGWRAGYLAEAAARVASGEFAEARLRALPTDEARALLMTLRGVGPKVADCVLLFGLDRAEAFPADVHIRRAMRRLFPAGLPKCAAPCAGIAQQYLFCAQRGGQL